MSPSAVALIPARGGSKRVPHKNILPLGRLPLLAYTVSAARASECFRAVVVSTDCEEIAGVARRHGAEVPGLRPAELAGDRALDIEWVRYTLEVLAAAGRDFDAFSILRPTSPFRSPDTIRRAWQTFLSADGADSLRAVEPVRQHPGKMWVIRGQRMHPLLPLGKPDRPWHSSPTQSLPEIHVQNASLEIAWTRVVAERGTIAGESVVPFLTEGWEGFDINEPEDLECARRAVAEGLAALPVVPAPAADAASDGARPGDGARGPKPAPPGARP